jgi:xanthine dehydrogenase YagS FAD-binding subunit
MKALAPCKYYEATSVEDATSILKDYEGKAMIYAGGTEILDLMKKRFRPTPEILVNIKKIPGLNMIEEKSDGLHIGPTVTIADLAEKAPIPMLKDAAKSVSTPQLRNAGTVGGNLCQEVRCWYYRWPAWNCYRKGGPSCFAPGGRNAYHAIMEQKVCQAVVPSDLAPCLTALNATVKITGAGSRDAAMKDFYVVLGNVLKPEEMITDIVIPEKPSKGTFIKSAPRAVLDFATASVAAATTSKGTTVALGGVAPIIPSGTPSEMEAALGTASPLSDNKYKVNVAKHLLKQATM